MSKSRKKFFIIAAIILLLLAGSIGFIIQAFVGNNNNPINPNPTPQPTATSTGIPQPSYVDGAGVDLTAAYETEQYNAGMATILGNFTEKVDLGQLHDAYLPLARYTIEEYVQNSIANPYFVSDFWGQEDDYRADSLQTYLTPLMSDELAEQFIAPAEDSESEEFQTYYSSRLHLPTEGMTASPYCQENFDLEVCFSYNPGSPYYEYTDFTLTPVEGTDNQVQGSVTVQVKPFYQKPDSPEGNTVYEERIYTLNFTLQLNDEETSGKLDEKPILEFVKLDGSLVIGQTIDDLVMQTGDE